MGDPSLRSTEYLASCSLCLLATVWRLRAALRWHHIFRTKRPGGQINPEYAKTVPVPGQDSPLLEQSATSGRHPKARQRPCRRYSFFQFDQIVIAVTDSLSVPP